MATSRTARTTTAKKRRAPRRKKATAADMRLALKDQPLVGLTAAAAILGIKAPNVSRLRSQGRMPEGVPIEGSAMVYVRSEIEALAVELASERVGR